MVHSGYHRYTLSHAEFFSAANPPNGCIRHPGGAVLVHRNANALGLSPSRIIVMLSNYNDWPSLFCHSITRAINGADLAFGHLRAGVFASPVKFLTEEKCANYNGTTKKNIKITGQKRRCRGWQRPSVFSHHALRHKNYCVSNYPCDTGGKTL
ncbi:MAG: hypothetical protein JXR76_09125 [Deltaproteobacteria bacterium]|nr:hypothetical protein [Deltaproteobacteria bacterium]